MMHIKCLTQYLALSKNEKIMSTLIMSNIYIHFLLDITIIMKNLDSSFLNLLIGILHMNNFMLM